MNYLKIAENYAYKLHLAAVSCSDQSSIDDLMEKVSRDLNVEDLFEMVECVDSMAESSQWILRKRLISMGHNIEYVRGRKIVYHLDCEWNVFEGKDVVRIRITKPHKAVYEADPSFAASTCGGISLFRTLTASTIVAFTEQKRVSDE